MLLLSSADFFQNKLFQKIISGTLSECQRVWIQIRTDILSVLIWIQTVCNSYQQMIKVALARKEELIGFRKSLNLSCATEADCGLHKYSQSNQNAIFHGLDDGINEFLIYKSFLCIKIRTCYHEMVTLYIFYYQILKCIG